MLDFLKKNEEERENYWSILIENQWITSAIWQIKGGKVEIVASSPGTRWEGDLSEAVDATLSSCTQSLPDDFPDPSKTVFGVSSSWIQDGNIKEEYLLKLKKICGDLSLVPSGFVVLSEAISHFIKNKEQTLFSGITLGVSDQSLDISVFDLGKLVGTTIVSRSILVSDDLLEGLSRLTTSSHNFPPRIVLYNQKETELEEIKGGLNEIDWEKVETLKFLHAPTVEILDPSDKILAVSLAGGSEISQVDGIENMPEDEIRNVSELEGVTAEDLGFVVDTPNNPKISLPKFNIKLPKLPRMNLSFSSKPFIFGGISFFIVFVLCFLVWWFLPKATVTIFVAPKKLENNVTINLGSDLSGDTIDTSVSGEKTKSTTGTKTVGEKAKGQVKVQNGTAFPINLTAGTILLSSSDIKFVTAKQASISGALSPSDPGTTVLDVEAYGIGSEFNLAKDEILKVGSYPKAEVDATITANFTGGSSRQISAVSDDDRN